jgi:hypothetical protein
MPQPLQPNGSDTDTDAIAGDAQGVFHPSLVTLSVTGVATPEPSTWAMVLLGFVGLGYLGYRRAS